MKLKLEKGQLLLRTFEESEAETLFQMIDQNREHLGKWFSWLEKNTKTENTATFIKEENEKFAQKKGLYLGIWNEGVLCGAISLDHIDKENKNGMIGYWLSKESVGKGIMYRSCKMLIDYAFNNLNLHRIDINHVTNNSRSESLIKRLGFTQEGMRRECRLLHGKYMNHVSYGLLSSEWNDSK